MVQERRDEKTGAIIVEGSDQGDFFRVHNHDGDGKADGLTVTAIGADGEVESSRNYSEAEARRLQIHGGGDDQIEVGRDVQIGIEIYGGDGDDRIGGGGGNDRIIGGDGNDRLYGNDGDDTIGGNTGNDEIYAGRGNDLTTGGEGNDAIYGGAGDDEIYGQAGRDTLDGEGGEDYVYGQEGQDVVKGEYAHQ